MTEATMDLFDAIYTQRAIRSFKSDPVPRAAITKLIEAATKAPSAGNSQPWAFVVVDDRETIGKLASLARKQFDRNYEAALGRMKPGDPLPFPRLKPMIENFANIPALIYPCMVRPAGQPATDPGPLTSVIPAVQNILLAARGLGLGAAFTGQTLRDMNAVREILGLPESIEPVAMIPLGYPDKERYGRITRRPVGEVLHWNKWEGDKTNTAAPTHR